MDDSENEDMYTTKPSFRSKSSIRNPNSFPMNAQVFQNENTFQREEDESDDEDEEEEEEEDNPGFNKAQNDYYFNSYYGNDPRDTKRRKMESLPPAYESVPRSSSGANLSKGSHAVGSSRESWNEEESFVLLEVWGERYLELGRRSLRAEDWSEVAEKVSEMSGGAPKKEMQCRNQFDVLKKKYKKERAKLEKIGGCFASEWVFFKKMDVLLNLRMRGHGGLGCGFDSGEYVFMNPRVYLDKSNVLDEMRDSPGQSDEEIEEDGDCFSRDEEQRHGESARLLADSIHKFGAIYEKIESSKRRQMLELEKMKRDFQRELELQKKQIVERAQEEIAKIRERDDDTEDDDAEDDTNDDANNDVPVENIRE